MNNEYEISFKKVQADLLEWAYKEEQKHFARKVLRVYGKCLELKHFELGAKICKKYNHFFTSANRSDIAMAFGYAMMAQKQNP